MKRPRVLSAAILLTSLLLLSLMPKAQLLLSGSTPLSLAQGPEPQASSRTQALLGSAFTYQGRLIDAGTPIDNTCDFQFSLYDAATAGSQVGPTQTTTGVTVTDGRFTVLLDFGDVFDGTALWLEAEVQCTGDSAYTPLPSRQPLTAAPYAVTSQYSPWSGITAMPAGFADNVDDDTLAGIVATAGQVAKWDGSSWVAAADEDADTTYSAGTGLALAGAVFSADPTYLQRRLANACAVDFAIRQVGQDGSVTCEADDDTTYSAGTGLELAGAALRVVASYRLAQGCGSGQIAEWNGSAWLCGDDDIGSGDYWSLSGNAGTTPGTHFVGTTDNTALELHVNGARALRLEPHATSPNLIGGYRDNSVTAGVVGATIGGGGTIAALNRVTDNYGTVGGGYGNLAGDNAGATNDASRATVGGGRSSFARGVSATAGGGRYNAADGDYATAGGGDDNDVFADYATVPGGYDNNTTGTYSFAAGRRVQVNHQGAFVWADTTDAVFASERANQFRLRANGGVRFETMASHWFYFHYIPPFGGSVLQTATSAHLSAGGNWINASDRNNKENLDPVNSQAVLARLAELPITTWNYKAESPASRHMGPVAQDFYAAFGLGGSDTHIASSDTSGAALAAIQALYEENQALEQRKNDLEARLAALEAGSAGPTRPWSKGLLPGAGLLLAMIGLVWLSRRRVEAPTSWGCRSEAKAVSRPGRCNALSQTTWPGKFRTFAQVNRRKIMGLEKVRCTYICAPQILATLERLRGQSDKGLPRQRKRLFPAALVLLILLLLSLGLSAQPPLSLAQGPAALTGTSFTYQGRLIDNGTPVDDACDFQFNLYDAATAGNQVGPTQAATAVAVTDGRFTVLLDFGDVLNGTALWLETSAQCSGDSGYTTLAPRQPLTAAPYAVTSQHSPWSGITAMPAGFADNVDDDTLAGLNAATGQVAKWDGSAWVAAADEDTDTTYSAGTGLVLAGTVFSADPTYLQRRVDEACAAGFAIRQMGQDGSVTCEADDDTTYSAGTGLELVGAAFRVITSYRLPQGCGSGQIAEWNGSAWPCGDDDTGDSLYWSLTGNAGTTPGTHFLGSTDDAALELHVDGYRVLRLEPHATSPNRIGGFPLNSVTAGVMGATIGGGGSINMNANRVTDDYGTVGGGYGNRAGDWAGGTNDAAYATVGGGRGNTAGALYATVGGGLSNTAGGDYATVGGGQSNAASGYYATIPGGYDNTAAASNSFAAGRRAQANHRGAFVWADSTDADFASELDNQFRVRVGGGAYFEINNGHWFEFRWSPIPPTSVLRTSTGAYLSTGGTWTDSSDRDKKENFAPVDGQAVLARLAELPITTWNYKAESPAVRHMGPVAQDFYAAFGLGGSDTHIAPSDTSGVALVAIQALYQENQALRQQENDLESRLAALETGSPGPAQPWPLLPGAGLLLAVIGLAWLSRRWVEAPTSWGCRSEAKAVSRPGRCTYIRAPQILATLKRLRGQPGGGLPGRKMRPFPATLALLILLLLSLGLSATPLMAQRSLRTQRTLSLAQGPVPSRVEGPQQDLQPAALAGTSFTYQGQLIDNGTPVDSACDFQFGLYDAVTAGNQVGPTRTATGVTVTNGRFTVLLDFGDVFDGTALWLEAEVQCTGDPAYSTFSPRQPLTAAPYAITSQHSPWSGITAMPAGFADNVDDDTLAGINATAGQVAKWDGSAWVAAADEDSDTTYSAGTGLELAGTVFSADPTYLQRRVADACGAGSAIRQVGQDGSVTCEADDDTTYSAGTGLELAGAAFRLLASYRLPQGCSGGQIAEWSGSAWGCGDDDVRSGNYWSLGGNAGTTPGTHFLGTTDNAALELHVNGARALALLGSSNLIGGHSNNSITAGVWGTTIGGGGFTGYNNRVTDDYGTVGGGEGNRAGDNAGATDDASRATVGGGSNNTANAPYATVGGGSRNSADGLAATVGGGYLNTASGDYATVPGGLDNTAPGDYSFAAGRRAQANHQGAFVWADSADADLISERDNQFRVRANGGVRFDINNSHWFDFRETGGGVLWTSTGAYLSTGGVWTNSSDRNKKENFAPVDGQEVLARLAELPITTWNYKAEPPAVQHMGPVAQDFYAAFGLGGSDTHIAPSDTGGVALAAIQALYGKKQDLRQQVNDLEGRLAALEAGSGTSARPWASSPLLSAGLLLAMIGLIWLSLRRGVVPSLSKEGTRSTIPVRTRMARHGGDTMRHRTIILLVIALLLGALFLAGSTPGSAGGTAFAQSPDQTYDLSWHTVDGGGHTWSTGGTYRLGGTVGQPDAGSLAGGDYDLGGGFWEGGAVAEVLHKVYLPLILRSFMP